MKSLSMTLWEVCVVLLMSLMLPLIAPITQAADPGVPDDGQSDRRAIAELMQGMSAGVENRNLDGVMALFATSPDLVLIGSKRGKIARGRQEIRELFTGIISAPAQTRLVWKTYSISVLGDVAWLFALADLVHEDAYGVSTVPYRVTSVFVRRDEGWKGMQYHGSEPVGG